MNRTILIADDETRMRILVADFLEQAGYNTIEAKNGEEALSLYGKHPDIDLLILDVMMPLMNGWEVCHAIRDYSKVPIIMLTAKNTETDELTGFQKGADEYITKPFSPMILVARVNALIKRTYMDKQVYSKGLLLVDYNRISVTVDHVPVELSQTEYRLLTFFIENEQQVISREQLLNHIWGMDYFGTDRTVDTHINRLRMKLLAAGTYIQTVRGHGYKYEVK
ncbi:MAG: response regulator transcription factor [Vallitaleaceae bacterium]|jgi:DNA-binding response OmpR family regulator|nr:response regulator transcription factor [Vallitaleaceae bacterium]